MRQKTTKYLYGFLAVVCLLGISSFVWLLNSQENELAEVSSIPQETAAKSERRVLEIVNHEEGESDSFKTSQAEQSPKEFFPDVSPSAENKVPSSAYIRITDEEYESYEQLKNDIEQSRLDLIDAFASMAPSEQGAALKEWNLTNRENTRKVTKMENQLFLEENFPHRFKR